MSLSGPLKYFAQFTFDAKFYFEENDKRFFILNLIKCKDAHLDGDEIPILIT